VLQYAYLKELLPPVNGVVTPERALQRLSVMPAMHFGDRVTVSAGAHLAHSNEAGSPLLMLVGSLRPSLRVFKGLELAAEARRGRGATEAIGTPCAERSATASPTRCCWPWVTR